MSLILEGIDLPETKDDRYIIQVYKNGDVFIGKETWDDTKKGRDKITQAYLGKYQAIQIPKGHGRLIDIEKLKEEFAMKNNICKECDSFKKCDNKTYSKSEICEKFIWVPTILESEGGE